MKQTRSKYSSPDEKRLGRSLAVKARQNQPHTVYLLRNKHTNQIYIGSSHHAFARFGDHLSFAADGNMDCPKLYDSMRIYKNHQDWHFVELFQMENAFLAKEAEDYMIEFYDTINNGLNTKLNREMLMTKEIKEKMSKTRIERKIALGVNNAKASITENQVKEIKALLKENRTILDIESITGISAKKIRRIRSGETWLNSCELNGFQPKEIHDVIGQNNGRAKITEDDVKQIKIRLLHGDSHKSIADEFKITKHSVENIKYGLTWSHVFVDGWIIQKENKKPSYPKISKEIALNIKNAILQGKATKDIVKEFNVSKTTVQFIKNGKTWKNLSENME